MEPSHPTRTFNYFTVILIPGTHQPLLPQFLTVGNGGKENASQICEVSITKVQPPAIVFKLRDNRMFSDVTKANDMISVSLTVSCCQAYPGQLA